MSTAPRNKRFPAAAGLCRRAPGRRARRRAFTLIEAVIAIAIVGIMLAAALNTVGASRTSQSLTALRRQGHGLAEQLLSEILQQPYQDPVEAASILGPAASETATGNRTLFNDVDDYDGWKASPPQYRDGSVTAFSSDWQRKVKVCWVNPANLSQKVHADAGVKRIVVEVTFNKKPVATLTAYRCNVD